MISSASWDSWLIQIELQLQVTEEELLEFPEIRSDQINTSHTDNSAGEAIPSAEKSSYIKRCNVATSFKIKAEKLQYRWPVVYRRQPVTSPWHPIARWPVGSPQNPIARQPVTLPTLEHRKQKGDQLPIHIPSIFDIQVRPNLTAFAKTLTPEALRYLYLGIDLGWTLCNCSQ